MRVAYHIESHRLPGQLLRLVTTLREGSPDGIVLVSHDRRGDPLDAAPFAAMPGVHVLSATGGYGDFSHVARWLESVAWLREHDVDVDWLVNLSGQDYPVRPVHQIEQELAEASVDAFLEHWPVFGEGSHWSPRRARTRYYYRHRRLPVSNPRVRSALRVASAANLVQPLVRFNAAFGSVGVRSGAPFRPGFECYGGSFFASLSWPCVEEVWRASRHEPLLRYFRGVLAPEEIFFQTVLVNSGRFRLDPDCRRWFDFSHSQANHPRTLDVTDVPAVVASGAHFARKFDTSRDPAVLDALDAHVRSGVH